MHRFFKSSKKRVLPPFGLALGGGGARGLAHIAFLKVLDDLGIRPAVIAGTSMGAVIGALYASGHSGRQIEKIFRSMNFIEIISLVDISWLHASEGLIRGDKIIQTVGKLTKAKTFADLAIPLRVVATDFWKQTEVIFQKGDLLEALRASISLPGIFEPVVKDHRVLIDGGMVNSLPYELLQTECKLVIAVSVIGEAVSDGHAEKKPRIFEAIFTAFQIMEKAALAQKLCRIQPDIILEPALTNIEVFGFNQLDAILNESQGEAERLRAFLMSFKLPGSSAVAEHPGTDQK